MTKALADELERLEKRCAEIDAHYARYPNTPDRTAEQHAADIRAILSALREAGEPVAEGMVLVPREPTEEMLKAWFAEEYRQHTEPKPDPKACYAALLSAAEGAQ